MGYQWFPIPELDGSPGPHRIAGRVNLGECHPGQADGAVRITGQIRRLGGELQHRGVVQAEPPVGVRDLVPQLERGLVVALGIGEPVGG